MPITLVKLVRGNWKPLYLAVAVAMFAGSQSAFSGEVQAADQAPEQKSQSANTDEESCDTEALARVKQSIKDTTLDARDGNARAQYQLGARYELGTEVCGETLVPKDLSLAEDWYLRSAAGGYAKGYYSVGCVIYKAAGRARGREAAAFVIRAAEKGVLEAQAEVAKYFWHGIGVDQDYKASWLWSTHAMRGALDVDKKNESISTMVAVLYVYSDDSCSPSIPLLPLPPEADIIPGMRLLD